jgi:hypothetical protein
VADYRHGLRPLALLFLLSAVTWMLWTIKWPKTAVAISVAARAMAAAAVRC